MAKRSNIRKENQGLQERAMLTRQAILTAAIRILEKKGREGFNTNSIAEQAGLSVGSLYQYFGNKEAILEELVRNSIDERVAAAKNILVSDKKYKSSDDLVSDLVEAAMQTPKLTPEVDQILFDYSHFILKKERMKRVDERLVPLMRDYVHHFFPQAKKRDIDLMLLIVMRSTRGVITVSQADGFKSHSKQEIKKELCLLVHSYLSHK